MRNPSIYGREHSLHQRQLYPHLQAETEAVRGVTRDYSHSNVTEEEAMQIETQHATETAARACAREAVSQASKDHWRFHCVEYALRDARVELASKLVPYEDRLHVHPGFLTPEQDADYSYIKGVLEPLIEAVKVARAANQQAGNATGKVLAEAKKMLDELLPF